MYTVETILNSINGRGYRIRVSYVQKMLKETIKEGGKLKRELTAYGKVDFTNNREIITFINKNLLGRDAVNEKTVSNAILEELYTDTKNSFFQTLIAYRKESDRYTKVASFIKNVVDPDFNKNEKESVKAFVEKEKFGDIRISPTAKLNVSGGISLSNPSLPFSTEDIKEIFLNDYIDMPCKNIEGILYILNKYRDLLSNDNYIVIGTTLYADIIYSEWNRIPVPDPEEEELKQMEDFRREFGLDYYGNRIKEE